MELLLTGKLLDAERARELGLVNFLAAPGEARAEAAALAARLAAQPAAAVRSAKQAARGALEEGLDTGLDRERELFLAVAATEDAREGAAAFLEKRPPAFRHR
jgi:enoyl-CoA hydratase